MRKIKWPLIAALTLGVGFAGCGEKEKKAEETDPNAPVIPSGGFSGGASANDDTVQMPQVGAIALGGFDDVGTPALRLAGEEDDGKCDNPNLGVFGFAVGAACSTAPFASNLLLGSASGDFDADGDVDCADFAAAEANKTADGEGGAGIMMHLMCQSVFVANKDVTKFAFEEKSDTKEEGIAISFENYDSGIEAIGSWTKGNAASYPADIRFWSGTTLATSEPMFAMNLENIGKGIISIAKFDGKDINVKVDFSNVADTSSCASNPSKDTCHWQDLKIYSGPGVTDGIPNGFHLRIFADDKENPTFIAMQGRYNYDAANAEAQFNKDGSPLAAVRYVDFTAVRKGTQVWGRFEFTDENDEAITWLAGGNDILAPFSATAGICQNLDDDAAVACTDVDYTDYTALWESEDTFERISADPVSVDWTTGKPEKPGLCNTKSCLDF